ncbi:immunogenic protein MPT63 [Mycobacterium sp. MFM001]|uniref:MPT63 family protein n=1 Tax=Mycobacterium sp. MFM001 TaxID=2049453 RepID=UPI000DA59B26|nr:MPT63 family protein [Mycobacterium sp. MFM001]GBE66484.1 immunogenic protein MPT63 [Mycobacterium sp. MFM001]
MKFTSTTVKTGIGAAALAAAGVFGAGVASAAPPTVQSLGTSEALFDGPMVTNYTVSNLQPSNAVIPGYTPQGKLYQADVTVRSDGGTVTPLISDFNARAADGTTYRVLDTVPAPNGVPPAPLNQGQQANGEIYFDVTGPPPNGVVYNDGVEDVLIWTTPSNVTHP